MKPIPTILLAMSSCWAAMSAAAVQPAFYVLDVPDPVKGNATLFVSSASLPKADLPFVTLDTAKMDCCFRFGPKPGTHKPPTRSEDDLTMLTLGNGDEASRYPGHLVASTATGKRPAEVDSLAFGIEGMTAVAAKGKQTYAITLQGSAKPVILRQCFSSEGVRFQLYRSASDKKPYASYYYYLGYDVEPDCK